MDQLRAADTAIITAAAAVESRSSKQQPRQALVWLDLIDEISGEELEAMQELLVREGGALAAAHTILSASDSFVKNVDGSEDWLDDLADAAEFEEVELSGGAGQSQWMKMDGVFVDMLHEDFKIGLQILPAAADDDDDDDDDDESVSGAGGASSAAVSLLDVFAAEELSAAVGEVLGKPVAAIYRGDTPTDVLFRLCVRSVLRF